MSLLNLSNKLILELSDNLSLPDMNSLLRTTRRLAGLLSEPLINRALCDPFSIYGREALYSAADRQDKVTVKRLMKAGLVDYGNDRSLRAQPILHDVILAGGERAAITMLECGADQELTSILPYKGPKALHLAILLRHENLVRALLSNDKADANWESQLIGTPLDTAIEMGNETMVRILLADPRVTVDKSAPLMRAARGGSQIKMCYLIDEGNIVDSLDDLRGGALYPAIPARSRDDTRLLLAIEGIDPSDPDPYGFRRYDPSVNERNAGVVRALLGDERIDVNAQGDGGWRALHIAAGCREWQVAEILLDDPRVDVNSRNDDGETPLHVAARLGRLEAVRLLLSRGDIRLDIENNRGDSVRGLAQRGYCSHEINDAILGYGLAG
ncbi:ankyrin repeat-containing domain protein [Tuber brumale]|nr:ankyrin repeat-containing domain protein [Tuber brumale]